MRASEKICVFIFKNYYFLQYSVGTYDTLSQKHIFSGLKLHAYIIKVSRSFAKFRTLTCDFSCVEFGTVARQLSP